jgi:hypothetical protein
VYANERSRWVMHGLVGTTSVFPCRLPVWYARASSRVIFFMAGLLDVFVGGGNLQEKDFTSAEHSL